MGIVDILEAKAHLFRLLESAATGEEIIIAKAGVPIARLGPPPLVSNPRRPGLLRGKIRVRDDFDAPLPGATEKAFRGESA